jgi:cytosine/adenosine deaminase-related metal-dependent hydrolase
LNRIKVARLWLCRTTFITTPTLASSVPRVSGSYYDGVRFREGTVGWDADIVTEVRAGRANDAIATGLIVPGFWNAHTHLGDAVITQELRGTLEELVAPPGGLKHRVLAKAKDEAVVAAMRRAMATMLRTGTTGFADFREGGLRGLRLLYAAGTAMPLRTVALGRPSGLRYEGAEVAALLRACDGIAVSSYVDWPSGELPKIADDVRRAGKIFTVHCSERIREDVDEVLDLHPAFLVHMVQATDADLERCVDSHVPIVVCPRSNAFFGATPDLPRMLRLGVELRLGTDNAMINSPSVLQEMDFAYRIARLRGEFPAKEILAMALRGRRLSDPADVGAIRVGGPADLVVLDLPGGPSGFASLVRASPSDVRLVVSSGTVWDSATTERARPKKMLHRPR